MRKMDGAVLTSGSCMIQAGYWTGYMTLWLKADGWSIELINILPTFINIVQACSSWLGTTLAGVVSIRIMFSFQSVSRPHVPVDLH